MLRKALISLLIAVAIPIVGFLIANWIINSMNTDLAEIDFPPIELMCATQPLLEYSEVRALCGDFHPIALLRDGSIWAGVVPLALMALYILSSLIAGKSRRLNAAIFPKLIPLSILTISGLVLVQGAILTYAVYIGESWFFERIHIFIIGAIGIGAVIGALRLIAATFSIGKTLTQPMLAKLIDDQESPTLCKFVHDLADTVRAKKPDNIIVGLEPNFFATAANIKVLNENKTLSGETLYLSLPLMRLFNLDELRAVVGHELGHFKGEDTTYSLRFAPAYTGLSRAIAVLGDEDSDATSLAKLPAISMLSLMFDCFSRNERRISRDREFEADRIGTGVSSAKALATALGKVAVYAPLWSRVREQNVDRLNSGKVTANLSQVYEDSARFDVSHKAANELLDDILHVEISHPTDSHPTISERFQNIGFDADQLTLDMLIDTGSSSTEILDNLNEIEEALSLDEHRLMAALGAVHPPEKDEDTDEEPNTLLTAMYTLAAAMVGADDKIEQSEVSTAEDIGSSMLPEFDQVEFREFCNNIGELPAFRDVVDILASPLRDEHKTTIYEYLKEIAMADGDLADEENELLLYTRQRWGVEV